MTIDTETPTLVEEVAVWRATTMGTIEDLAELDRILSRHRRFTQDFTVRILDRIRDEDVPVNVAADIEQIIVEADFLVPLTPSFRIVTDDGGEDAWTPDEEFTTQDAAATFVDDRPWMHELGDVKIVRRVSVDTVVADALARKAGAL